MSTPISDPVLIFASVMVLILIAPLFAKRVRLPEIVGLIAAGIVVGPHGLGILARDQTIDLLGTVGLLFIMFLAGLEIDLNQVRRKKSHTIIFGLLTFTIPLLTGTVLGVYGFGKSIAASILLASMFSSHTLLTFPIIASLDSQSNSGYYNNRWNDNHRYVSPSCSCCYFCIKPVKLLQSSGFGWL